MLYNSALNIHYFYEASNLEISYPKSLNGYFLQFQKQSIYLKVTYRISKCQMDDASTVYLIAIQIMLTTHCPLLINH